MAKNESSWSELDEGERIMVRDVFMGLRAACRLLALAQDDMGDLLTAIRRRELEPVRKELEQMQDEIGAADERFEKFRQRLAVLSRGKR